MSGRPDALRTMTAARLNCIIALAHWNILENIYDKSLSKSFVWRCSEFAENLATVMQL
jgi:hypothetical protein